MTHVATRYARGRLLCSDLHTPMESMGYGREIEATKRKENKKDEKKRAFAQHLPDYSFRRPGGFTDGKRVRQRQSSREKESEKRTDQGHGDHRLPGIRTYLQIYLSWFDRAGKLKGQTMYARYSVRTR